MDSTEFYDMALDPDFPDEMMFELTAEDPSDEKTFSADGMNQIADQMFAFAMARTFAFWKRNNRPARKMRARVSLELLDADGNFVETVQNGDLPYFEAGDTNGLAILDGNRRIPRQRFLPLDD